MLALVRQIRDVKEFSVAACRQAQASQALSLPPEVWTNIADHLTLKEWDMAAGTCRMMWNLQLTRIAFEKLRSIAEGELDAEKFSSSLADLPCLRRLSINSVPDIMDMPVLDLCKSF